MLAIGAAIIMLVGATPCTATLIEFTDRDAWYEGAGDAAEITYTEFPDDTTLSDQYEDLGILFTDVDDFILYSDLFSDGAGALGGVIHDELRVSFAEPIQWLGADFLEGLEYELYLDGQPVGATGEFRQGISSFAGLFSDVPFDAAIIRDPGGGTSVDDLYFQQIVPVPGVLAMSVAAGLVGGVGRGRRRRRPHAHDR